MNFLMTLIYMYIMITFIYPIIAEQFNLNNRIGFTMFVIVSFLSAKLISNYFNKKVLDFADLMDKSIYNSLILVTTNFIVSDLSNVQFNNLLGRYMVETSKSYFGKGVVILMPLLGIHLLRSLLKPY